MIACSTDDLLSHPISDDKTGIKLAAIINMTSQREDRCTRGSNAFFAGVLVTAPELPLPGKSKFDPRSRHTVI